MNKIYSKNNLTGISIKEKYLDPNWNIHKRFARVSLPNNTFHFIRIKTVVTNINNPTVENSRKTFILSQNINNTITIIKTVFAVIHTRSHSQWPVIKMFETTSNDRHRIRIMLCRLTAIR